MAPSDCRRFTEVLKPLATLSRRKFLAFLVISVRHVRGFCGILQADGYAGFAALYGDGRVVEAACLAHARRKYFDEHVRNQSPIAAEALKRIAALYAVEKEIRGRPPDSGAARSARTAPLMVDLHDWLRATQARFSDAANSRRRSATRCRAGTG